MSACAFNILNCYILNSEISTSKICAITIYAVSKRTVLPAPDHTRSLGTPPRKAKCAVVESPKNVIRSTGSSPEACVFKGNENRIANTNNAEIHVRYNRNRMRRLFI